MKEIAIDFGTSRTKLAYVDPRSGRTELMRLGIYDQPFLPSLFYLTRDSEQILLGDEAEDMVAEDPAGVVGVLKRRLHDPYVRANYRKEPPVKLLTQLFHYLRERAGREIASFL